MIALYKDPKGETIFDKYETPSFKSQQQQHTYTQRQQQQRTCTDSSSESMDSLKKRIQELENMLANQEPATQHESGMQK